MRARPGGLLLIPAAALVVHQARYSLTYGPRTSAELAVQGHAYLHSLVPWTVLALGVVALLRLGRAVLRLASRCAGAATRARRACMRLPSSIALVAPSPLALARAGRAPPRRTG